jgi:hypothetical protein
MYFTEAANMSSESITDLGDSPGYTRDSVRAILKAATWYVRLRNPAKVARLLAHVQVMVEQRGGLADAVLNRVLDKYADEFRALKRPLEAGQLAELAQRVRENFSDQFYPDGADKPWWLQQSFLLGAPELPLEYRSSHAIDTGGADQWIVGAVTLVVLMVATAVLDPWLRLLGGWQFLSWLIVPIVAGRAVRRWNHEKVLRRGAESMVRLAPEGIEYRDPGQHRYFRWSQIRHVWTSWESGAGEDVTHPSVVVVGEEGSFEVSSRFFTEHEVHLVNGLSKLHSGQTAFEDWREAPRD